MDLSRVYDSIAECWCRRRKKPFDELVKTARKWKKGLVLDAGCGSARHTAYLEKQGFRTVGLDFSKNMIKLAKKISKESRYIVADIENLPFKQSSFDYVVCLAVIHHLKSRAMALKELKQVLKPRGEALFSVWYKPGRKDEYVPWTYNNRKYLRYYHFFSLPELRKELEKAGFRILNIYLDEKKQNIFALAANYFR